MVERDATGTTLYLSHGTELHLSKSGTVTGTRYYASDGSALAIRTGGRLTFTFTDHHNTATTQVSADAAQAVTRRKTQPFGSRRGAEAKGWTGDKGFLGGAEDETTLTIHLGAREYDPATARFVSVDPEIDLNDPQATHGYTYGNNNPVTNSDPTGTPLKTSSAKPSTQAGARRQLDPSTSDSTSERVSTGALSASPSTSTRRKRCWVLKGDDREMSKDPHAPYRMSLFWNTASGEVSFTVSPSHTVPHRVPVAESVGRSNRTKFVTDPGRMLYANPLTVGGHPSDTNGDNSVLNYEGFGHHSTADELDIGVHAVNSLARYFAVDNHIKIKATRTSVTVSRAGDPYPDMEVVQYRANQSPRVIATDRMASTSGMDSIPVWPGKIDRTWTNNRCVKGC